MITENTPSGSGDGGGNEYSADDKSLESSAGGKNTNLKVCKTGSLNSATVSLLFSGGAKCRFVKPIFEGIYS